MSTTPSSSSQNAVSASKYLHLAPVAAQDAFSRDQIRQLVLEYMTSCCYADSAKAFAREVDSLDRASTTEQPNGDQARDPTHDRNATLSDRPTTPSEDAMEGIELTSAAHQGSQGSDDARKPDSAMDEDGVASTTRPIHGRNVVFRIEREDVDDEAAGEMDVPCSLLTSEQLVDLNLRRDIREHIWNGRISNAVDLINEHFPTVLSENADSKIGASSVQSCEATSFFVPTPSSARSPAMDGVPASKSAVPILGAAFGSWSLSLQPQILALNLQLQSFVELMRSAHAVPSAPATPTRHNNLSDSLYSEAAMSASTSSIGSLSGNHSVLNVAIAQSQALNAKVRQLPPGKDKEKWEQECIDVSGLMAYKDLATCPVRGYLAQERREVLAELVNAAILQRTGRTPIPVMSLAARQCVAIWSTLSEWKVQFPPAPPSSSKESNNKSKTRTFPRFDLRTFLSEGDPRPLTTETATATNGDTAAANGNVPSV
ncbi:hypothetical protein OIV83_001454 [Microbotryomycetes sp. JL201]|nr:hypothetical protein OIV83_001454 [Microbotryomycetes sp. JL201]